MLANLLGCFIDLDFFKFFLLLIQSCSLYDSKKILLVIVIITFLGFAILAFQLTRGVSDLDSSSELQEAMPALP